MKKNKLIKLIRENIAFLKIKNKKLLNEVYIGCCDDENPKYSATCCKKKRNDCCDLDIAFYPGASGCCEKVSGPIKQKKNLGF